MFIKKCNFLTVHRILLSLKLVISRHEAFLCLRSNSTFLINKGQNLIYSSQEEYLYYIATPLLIISLNIGHTSLVSLFHFYILLTTIWHLPSRLQCESYIPVGIQYSSNEHKENVGRTWQWFYNNTVPTYYCRSMHRINKYDLIISIRFIDLNASIGYFRSKTKCLLIMLYYCS